MKFEECGKYFVGYTDENHYLHISWKININYYGWGTPYRLDDIKVSIFSKSCYERHYAKKK